MYVCMYVCIYIYIYIYIYMFVYYEYYHYLPQARRVAEVLEEVQGPQAQRPQQQLH